MTRKFVRYSPDVEQEEPDFEQTLQQVIDDMKQHMRGSLKTEGIGLVVRNAHAKGYGLARENLKSSVECRTNMRRASTPNRDATKPWSFLKRDQPRWRRSVPWTDHWHRAEDFRDRGKNPSRR